MGLSIGYRWTLPPDRGQEVPALVEQFAALAKQLSFAEVSAPAHLVGDACNPDHVDRDDPLLWAAIQSRYSEYEEGLENLAEEHRVPAELYVVRTLPGAGCEQANVGFRRSAATGLWDWSSTCKTQYASSQEHGGTINFMRCHARVCSLLEKIAALGLVVTVHDEGGYWPTKNRKALEDALSAAQMVGMMFGGD